MLTLSLYLLFTNVAEYGCHKTVKYKWDKLIWNAYWTNQPAVSQFTDWSIQGLDNSCGLDDSETNQLSEMFYEIFLTSCNCHECDFKNLQSAKILVC